MRALPILPPGIASFQERAFAWRRCFYHLPFLCFLATIPNLCAQDANPPSPINTDRPAFADSSVVVPKQSLQIENGFLETTTLGQHGFDFSETQLRFGLGDKTELRFSVPDY
jgi:hypothetical protein